MGYEAELAAIRQAANARHLALRRLGWQARASSGARCGLYGICRSERRKLE